MMYGKTFPPIETDQTEKMNASTLSDKNRRKTTSTAEGQKTKWKTTSWRLGELCHLMHIKPKNLETVKPALKSPLKWLPQKTWYWSDRFHWWCEGKSTEILLAFPMIESKWMMRCTFDNQDCATFAVEQRSYHAVDEKFSKYDVYSRKEGCSTDHVMERHGMRFR